MECLTELAKTFELIAFTASSASYANAVIDVIDPYHNIFSHRLFRDNCIKLENGFYIKDLRILNRDLAKVVLVDNSILSFYPQIDNGIPIIPFYNDKNDVVLLLLKKYMLSLKESNDYRLNNISMFGLRSITIQT